jgi:hypothetical protein
MLAVRSHARNRRQDKQVCPHQITRQSIRTFVSRNASSRCGQDGDNDLLDMRKWIRQLAPP